jgi:teichuronic acid biosynthesis glycosyltransferase TuaG
MGILVSIITPAYNAECFIVETIQSILNQTYQEWELIVINDGSTDSTSELVTAFSDPRIYLIEQQNSGVSAARNAGLELVKGKYITFLDADDILPPKSLEARVAYFEANPDVDLLDGRAVVKDQSMQHDLRVHVPSYKGSLFPRLIRLDGKVFLTCYYMIKASVLGTTRFQEDMTHSEDIFFFLELASKQDIQYDFVEEEVFWYRVGHTSAMSNLAGYEEGYFQLLDKAAQLQKTTFSQSFFLYMKVARILFLTWIKQKKYKRAINSFVQVARIFMSRRHR